MKKALLLLLLALPCRLFAQNKPDCAKFHNGVFTIKSEMSGIITISRHGAVQTERTARGVMMTFNVKWINDCLCTLKPAPETIAKYNIPANAFLTVAITKPKKRSYFQITSSTTSARKAGLKR